MKQFYFDLIEKMIEELCTCEKRMEDYPNKSMNELKATCPKCSKEQ